MQQPNDFSIFLIIFNGLVTLVIAFGFFTIKAIYKKIAETDAEQKENRNHWDVEHAKLIENSSDEYTKLIEKQNTVKIELIKQQSDVKENLVYQQNSVKEELMSQQVAIKSELMNHYSLIERDLVRSINELNIILKEHLAAGGGLRD